MRDPQKTCDAILAFEEWLRADPKRMAVFDEYIRKLCSLPEEDEE